MKRIFINGVLTAFALLTVPAVFAQDKTEKEKNKDIQQIIITRTGDANAKTVIEINGDNVLVNGKITWQNEKHTGVRNGMILRNDNAAK